MQVVRLDARTGHPQRCRTAASWLPVRGVQLRRDGTEVGPVQVLVRAAQLPPS